MDVTKKHTYKIEFETVAVVEIGQEFIIINYHMQVFSPG